MAGFMNLQLADCHMHAGGLDGPSKVVEIMEASGFSAANILSIPTPGDESLHQNSLCLLAKALHQGKIYCFGGLRHPLPGTVHDPLPYEQQARRLIEAGCDGMKMLEGKPTERKALQEPLDSPRYDAYYAYLESDAVPLLYHVADPETFWDADASAEPEDNPWAYGDGTYPTKEEIYQEMERVLAKFPGLRIVFAHFYFLSADLDRAGRLLDKWPNVSLDLTPGGEMYWNFSKNPERSREFFLKYQDRILLGTDNMAGLWGWVTEKQEAVAQIKGIRTFLETDRTFEWLGGQQRGIALDLAALKKIYSGNFRRFAGDEPKAVDLRRAADECKRMIDLARTSPKREEVIPELEDIEAQLEDLQGSSAAGRRSSH